MKTILRLVILVMGISIAGATFNFFGQEPSQPATLYVYSGTLRSIDLQARTIIVDGSTVPQKFVVPTDAEIIVKGEPAGPKGKLGDLMVGNGVQVKYTVDDGVNVAHQISPVSVKNP
jgi:hypothetical protein